MKDLFDLKGKVAVVAGASSGLGADAARAYAEYGAQVALLARRKERLDELAEEITAAGGTAFAAACDVTVEESVKNAVEQVLTHYGKIDILLNNAGVAIKGSVEDTSAEDWDKVMDINVKGMYLMCKYVIPGMRSRQYGKIVNVASVNADNASKAAVRGLTMGMAATYMKDNITINSVGPGLFESEMTANTLFKNEEYLESYRKTNPASRPGRQGELNGTILFLSSDASSYVTSQHILVDGGYTII